MLSVHEAAKRNDLEVLKGLLDEEPGQVQQEDEAWPSGQPLHHACIGGSVEAAVLLLDRGAKVDRRDHDQATPLMRASEHGRIEVLPLLLARGADPGLHGPDRWTALILATMSKDRPGSDHVAVIRFLLNEGGVDVNARDKEGCTALYWACAEGHVDRARVLLVEGGADTTIGASFLSLFTRVPGDQTPIMAARTHGHEDCVRLLEVRGNAVLQQQLPVTVFVMRDDDGKKQRGS